MMFRRPQHVVAEAVHVLRDIAHGRKDLPQALVGITPIVGGRAGYSDIVELDLADIEDVEVPDHRAFPPSAITVEQTFVLGSCRRGWLAYAHPGGCRRKYSASPGSCFHCVLPRHSKCRLAISEP